MEAEAARNYPDDPARQFRTHPNAPVVINWRACHRRRWTCNADPRQALYTTLDHVNWHLARLRKYQWPHIEHYRAQ